jgi:NADH:ubiquinone oxidoreductase subunit C
MLINYVNIIKILPVVKIEIYGIQHCFLIQMNLLKNILTILKNHFRYQLKILTCISGVDFPANLYRFKLIYELLSLKYNNRLRVKIMFWMKSLQ